MDFNSNLQQIVQKITGWSHFDLTNKENKEKANGFSSERFFITVKNSETLDLVVKCAFKETKRRKEVNMGLAYINEICFYDKIMPRLLKFAEERGLKGLDFIPKVYGCLNEEFMETIAMEDLKVLGYKVVDRNRLLKEEEVIQVFQTYGKFHGLSFAFKDQNLGEYQELLNQTVDLFKLYEQQGKTEFGKTVKSVFEMAFETVDEDTKEKYKDYIENPHSIYLKCMNYYDGDYRCLLHGDCWSNNMMFKYQDSKLVNMKFLDFQLIKDDSPVFDLSYFLYAGTNIDIYGNLDKYLKIYHDSLCETIRILGSNPEKIFPWTALKEDWKKCAKIGIIMSLVVNKVKLINVEDLGDGSKIFEQMANAKLTDEVLDTYRRRSKELLEHAHIKGYLN